MQLSNRELWALIHGMGLGALFLLAFGGGIAGVWSLRSKFVTPEGLQERIPRLLIGTTVMAVVAWLTVIVGTWIVYPWYRAAPPAGTTDLTRFPRSLLLSSPDTAEWHNFGMEWKEHVAWIAPILATAVACVVVRYGARLAEDRRMRQALIVLFVVAFGAAAAAGLFGAFINKVAATR